jgi:hypothetical protein
VATWSELESIALSLPLVEEVVGGHGGWRTWKITGAKGRQVVWERPLGENDLRQLGAGAPTGETIALRVADLHAKRARLDEFDACFDIPHFATFSGLLVLLDEIDVDDLRELVDDSWLAVAPRRAAAAWLAARRPEA